MTNLNPFAKRGAEPAAAPPPKKSHWERLPQAYRDVCAAIAKNTRKGMSPQNRRVRDAADNFCRAKGIPTK